MTISTSTAPAVVPFVTRDIALDGVLDAAATLALRAPVTAWLQDGPAVVLVDIADVTGVTASGVAGILELRRLARTRGGDVRLHGTSHAVLHAQVAAELTAITRVYSTRNAALNAGSRNREAAGTGLSQDARHLSVRDRVQRRVVHTAHLLRLTVLELLRPLLVSARSRTRADVRTVPVPTPTGVETLVEGIDR